MRDACVAALETAQLCFMPWARRCCGEPKTQTQLAMVGRKTDGDFFQAPQTEVVRAEVERIGCADASLLVVVFKTLYADTDGSSLAD